MPDSDHNEIVDTAPAEESAQVPAVTAPQTAAQAVPRSHEPSSISLLFLVFCILLMASWFVGPRLVEEYHYASARGKLRAEYENAVSVLEDQPLKQVSLASRMVAQKVKPSVVSIRARKLGDGDTDGQWNAFGGEVMQGFGSGVIMSDEGYVVTNAHVIDNAESIRVELHDRRVYDAIEVGRDEISDIAVLKINASGLIPATWGDSEELQVGSIVWAIGSPYRYEQTVTSGIVSAKDRLGDPKGRVKNLLQTDAAVNPGNSGGPLVDSDGNVIGINTSIYGEYFRGISFAVPSSTAQFVYEQILERGNVVRGFLGARPTEVNHRMSERLGLPDLEGALLVRIQPDTPAFRAGLQTNDVVRKWNDKPIRNFNNLYRFAERSQPGSIVEVSLIRDGKPYLANVTVGELPQFESPIQIKVQR